jgi:methionyl aminopeptidase
MSLIKTKEEILIMAEGGILLAGIVKKLEKMVKPGITTKELDNTAEALIFECGAKPSFKGYDGFPAALCVSINEEVVHGIPSKREIKEGDIVSLDLGLEYKGYHSDMAVTVAVGNISPRAQELIGITKKSLEAGINKVRPGRTLGDVGQAIEECAKAHGFSVVRELCGHGIGKELHEDPQVLNYREKGFDQKIKTGMVFCLEPMLTIGDWNIKKSSDGYGFRTKDGSLSAHFEHMVVVTEKGCRVLTES